MKLLRELNEQVNIIVEAKEESGSKQYFLEGIFLQGDIKNRNGRIYPAEILDKQVNVYTESFIAKKRSFGELGHPDTPSINLDRVSHIITELKRDGSNFIGRAKITDTPNGKIVKALMDEGCTLGISSRGLGSLKESAQGKIVQPDFMLTTAGDIVADPSAPNAFLENVMESAEWVMEGGRWVPRYQEVAKEVINEAVRQRKSREEREAIYYKLFEDYLTQLSKGIK